MILMLALLLAASQNSLPVVEDAYSDIEEELDQAQFILNNAGMYTCQPDGAKAAFTPVHSKLDKLKRAAEAKLGRQLNLDIPLNSCRVQGDGPRFRELLRKAEWHLNKTAKLIRRGV